MQQIIDYLYYSLASGKHFMFFYLIFSCSIGLPTLVVLILANMKNRSKALTYMIYFLLVNTCQLIFISFVMYQHANIPFGFRMYQNVIAYSLESLTILFLPLLVNELFSVAHRRQIKYVFGFLIGIGLVLIIGPYFLGIYGKNTSPAYLLEGISITSLTSFKIYRILFWSANLYAFFMTIRKIKTVNNSEERNFYIHFMGILLVLVFNTIVPVIRTFPENVFVFATGYFFLNIIFLKYVNKRFFNDLNLLPSSLLPEMTTTDTQKLTDREKEVLLLLELGLTSKSIGDRLYISETTVKTHLKNIYHKFGVNNRTRLLYKLRSRMDLHEIQ